MFTFHCHSHRCTGGLAMAVQLHKGNMYLHPGMLHVQLRIEMHTVHTVSVVGVRISIVRPGDIRTYHICMSISHEYVYATSLCSALQKCVQMHPNHFTLPPLDCSTVAIKAPLGETSGLCSLAVPCVVSPSTVGSQCILCVQLYKQD